MSTRLPSVRAPGLEEPPTSSRTLTGAGRHHGPGPVLRTTGLGDAVTTRGHHAWTGVSVAGGILQSPRCPWSP